MFLLVFAHNVFLFVPKVGKRPTGDAVAEQAVKERDEKEQKIQVTRTFYLCVDP